MIGGWKKADEFEEIVKVWKEKKEKEEMPEEEKEKEQLQRILVISNMGNFQWIIDACGKGKQ